MRACSIMHNADFQFATNAPEADQPIALQFKDGPQTIPGWMVAHLGGPANVISALSNYASTVTFEQFTGEFFQEASSIELRRFHTRLIQEFLNRRD